MSNHRLQKCKLFANYDSKQTTQSSGTTIQQMNKYLEMESTDVDCLTFWFDKRCVLDKLVHAALRALGVPASSAPVERVFSQGGIILTPHRTRMSDKLLSKLIFIKCNQGFIPQ